MNQPPLTIFSDNGVLKGAIMPEPLDFKGLKKDSVFADYKFYTGFSNKDIQQQYEISKREAIEKALNVLNPEILDGLYVHHEFKIAEYVWPGTYEVREQGCTGVMVKTWLDISEIETGAFLVTRKVYHLSI